MPVKARHELKYFLNQCDYLALRGNIGAVLRPDPNADALGDYAIRSLYFDDAYNSAYRDKIAGNQDRDKYRIRIYNLSGQKIILERKRKLGSLIAKSSAPITRRLCDQLIAGDPTGLEKSNHPLLTDMYRMMRTRLLRPVVIVDYMREAYIHPAQRVRVTFDKRLRTGLMSKALFDPGLPTVQALDDEQVILEVKFDHYLPVYIDRMLTGCETPRTAISKYVICRRFEPIQ